MLYTGKSLDELIASRQISGEDARNILKAFYYSLDLSSKSKMGINQAVRSYYELRRVVLGRKPQIIRASVE